MTAPPAAALEACLALLEKAAFGQLSVSGTGFLLEDRHMFGDGVYGEAAPAIASAVNLLKDHGPALLAALRLREWRPIAEAPKNMSVLVARHGIEPVIAEYVMYTSAGYSWCCGYREMRDRPTHWMPLPAPPTADDLARVLEKGE